MSYTHGWRTKAHHTFFPSITAPEPATRCAVRIVPARPLTKADRTFTPGATLDLQDMYMQWLLSRSHI